MCVRIPLKFPVSSVTGHLKGKSAIPIARDFTARKRIFTEDTCWTHGYYLSPVGLDEEAITKCIR
jgi:putative transposase